MSQVQMLSKRFNFEIMKTGLAFVIILISLRVHGQVTPASRIPEDSPEFREELIQLALENFPNYTIEQYEVQIAKAQKNIARVAWLDQIAVSGNLNEFAIDPPPGAVNTLYPRYNVGLVIPFGIFMRYPMNKKIANEQYRISLLNVERMEMEIRKEVMTLYNDFLFSEGVFKLKSEIAEEAYTIFLSMEDKFANGEITLAQFNAASKEYKNELESRMAAKRQLDNAKLELEMWIGVSLEDLN